jgi:hypothetical protein
MYNAFIILLFVANFFRERRGFLGVNSLGDGVDMVHVPGYWYCCVGIVSYLRSNSTLPGRTAFISNICRFYEVNNTYGMDT